MRCAHPDTTSAVWNGALVTRTTFDLLHGAVRVHVPQATHIAHRNPNATCAVGDSTKVSRRSLPPTLLQIPNIDRVRSLLGELFQALRYRIFVLANAMIVEIAARVADKCTCAHCGHPTCLQRPHRVFPLRGLQPFFSTRSFIASISSACRAMIRSLRRLSSSSCLSRARLLVCMPPYLSRHK